MRLHEIENWARRVIAAVDRGMQREDSVVELKANWPEPRWTARQLAGHANAARGNPILWIIGVDEHKGVVGAPHREIGDWYAEIRSEFDSGVAPALIGHPMFEIDGCMVTPLAFGTERPPYVIKNPQRDSSKSGPFSREVPWREGTNVRSAGRAELLEILAEQIRLPSVEVLEAEASAIRNSDKKGKFVAWSLKATVYFTGTFGKPLIFPFHRMQVAAFSGNTGDVLIAFSSARISPPAIWSRDEGRRIVSATLDSTSDELIVNGSGKAYMECSTQVGDMANLSAQALSVTVNLFAAEHSLPVSFSFVVPWARHNGYSDSAVGIWKHGAA